MENAVKIARAATGRPAVIAYEGAFHGRTLMAMSLTSKHHPYKAGFGPVRAGGLPRRLPVRVPRPGGGDAAERALDDLRRAFTTRVAPESVAAIIIEPVQGEGGFVPAPAGVPARPARALRRARHRPDRRRGADRLRPHRPLFAIEHTGVEPDLICVAKSIAAGMPLSGVLGRARLMDAPGDSAIGGTYVGNPVACAAALAVLDEIDRRGPVRARGARSARRCAAPARAAGAHAATRRRARPRVDDRHRVRARPATREPAPELATRVVEHALRHGLILLKAGLDGNVIRTLVPLVITDAQLAEALDVLEAAIEHAVATVSARSVRRAR